MKNPFRLPMTPNFPIHPILPIPRPGVGRPMVGGIAFVALLVLVLVAGIWQKNQIDGILVANEGLRHDLSILEDAAEREDLAIKKLSSIDRIGPLAADRLALRITPSGTKAYIPVPVEPPPAPGELESRAETFVAAIRGAVDHVLPGTDATAGQ